MLHYCCICLPLLIMLGCALSLFATSEDNQPRMAPDAISGNSGMLSIAIDPRLELLAVIQYLSGSKMVFRGGPYADSVAAWFGEHKGHPLMQRLRDMEECGYVYDLPVGCFLLFEDISLEKKRFNWEATLEEMNLQRLSYVAQTGSLDEFYDMVRQFALESDFAGFFASQRDYLRKRVDDTVQVLNQKPDMIAHMVNWYGYSHASYNLVISPLVKGGYGPSLVDKDGGIHAYCVVDIDCNNYSDSDFRQLSSWFFHEFSHSYVNPLVAQHWDLFESGGANYEFIKNKMHHAYTSWWVVVAEHLVRVNDHRLSELFYKCENDGVLQGEIDSGFLFIRAAYEAIRQYEEEHKLKGTNYAGYFTDIAQYFMARTELSEEDIRHLQMFTGPINNVYENGVLIIFPDPDRVSGVRENIMPTIEWMVQNKEGYEAVSDQAALDMDLSNRSLCLYGAWGSNLILEKFRQIMPFEIHPDTLIADKSYAGTNLRIALCLPNPLNPKLGMCIYTAQTTEGMKKSNTIFHGPEDWYVSNSDLEVLGSGSFQNKDGRWRF